MGLRTQTYLHFLLLQLFLFYCNDLISSCDELNKTREGLWTRGKQKIITATPKKNKKEKTNLLSYFFI